MFSLCTKCLRSSHFFQTFILCTGRRDSGKKSTTPDFSIPRDGNGQKCEKMSTNHITYNSGIAHSQ